MKFSITTVCLVFFFGFAIGFLKYHFNIATVILSLILTGSLVLSILEDIRKENEY